MRGGVTNAGRRTNERRTLKIELLSQWKLEAEFRNKYLSNGLYSLKNSHISFGKGFQ